MPASQVQGPLDLPSTSTMPHFTPEDDLLPVSRSRSLPVGESTQGPSYGRRTQSEGSLMHSAPMHVLLSSLAADNAAPEQPSTTDIGPCTLQAPEQTDSAPSPVPTEIIPPELTQDEIVIDIQQMGIKVRDFAYEQFPLEMRAPELFDPILGWHIYEALLSNPNPKRICLDGRHLRRLLDLGWVSEEADGHRWLEKDWEALAKFDSYPHYPWRALNLTKPQKHDLRGVATSRFQWINAEQLVPQFVNRGISRVAAALRSSLRQASAYQKRHAHDATEIEEDAPASPQSKKRRLSPVTEPAEPEDQPSFPAHTPLELVNGKPPKQFPAGHATDSPPRPPPHLPSQGALSRSLQRHLSMTSVSPSVNDSRTGTNVNPDNLFKKPR